MTLDYDIIVIGGGHAGCEAASAAARLGSRTLLLTMDMGKMASMSCNPAVGGVAKGQIVREIDALGGQMGRITDLTTVQFRMLNRSKGAAMWSPKPLYLAGCGDRTAVRRRPAHGFRTTGYPGCRSKPEPGQPPVRRANAPYHGGPDPHGRRIHLPRRRAHLGNFPRRTDALRSLARRRRQGGGRRFARNHRVPSPNRFRKRTHENRNSGASRCPDHRL